MIRVYKLMRHTLFEIVLSWSKATQTDDIWENSLLISKPYANYESITFLQMIYNTVAYSIKERLLFK
jgi:hypothetical protein